MLPEGWADLPDDWRKRCDPHSEADARFWHSWHHERAEAIGCVYDSLAADARVAFFSCLKLVKGKWGGKQFTLLPYAEHQVVRPFFGYKEVGTDPPAHRREYDPLGRRQFRRFDLWIAKKNAKTTFGAGMGAEIAYFEREPGVEVYCCAADREQAGLIHQTLGPMIDEQPTLAAMSKRVESVKRIVIPSLNGFVQVNSSEAYTKHGLQPFGVLADELHAWPGREYWDVMTQGAFASREEWILAVMSTPGFSMHGIGYEEFEYANRVRLGQIDDARLLPVIHTLSPDDDWKDEANWYRANPALGYPGCGYPYVLELDDMRDEFRKALALPSNEQAFRVLRLATWLPNVTRWLDAVKFRKECSGDPEPFRDHAYFAGGDLSERYDLTAYVRMAWQEDGVLGVKGHYWLPAHGIEERERRDRVPYRQWARQGWLTLVPGDIIDYAPVRQYINERAAEDGAPVEIAYDPYNAKQLFEVSLPEDGFNTVPVRQGPTSLSDATKMLATLVMQGKVRHGGDPVLSWMAENAVVTSDSNGNIKPDKAPEGRRHRIDGISALVTGLSRAIVQRTPRESVYETRGIIEF